MADRYWLGVNTDWSDTANWSTTRNGSGGSTAPVLATNTHDVFIFDGTTDITQNISAVYFNSLTIGGNFRGNIGAIGSSMTIVEAASSIKVETCNKQFINLAASTTIATLYVDGTGNGAVNLTGGTFTNTRCGETGRVVVGASCVATNFYSAGMTAFIDAGTAATLIDIQGGSGHELRRSAATLKLCNAQLTAFLQAALTGTGTTASEILRGAQLRWASNGTIAEIVAKPGSVAYAGDVTFAITNSTVWASAKLFDNDRVVTYTNAPTLVGKSKR